MKKCIFAMVLAFGICGLMGCSKTNQKATPAVPQKCDPCCKDKCPNDKPCDKPCCPNKDKKCPPEGKVGTVQEKCDCPNCVCYGNGECSCGIYCYGCTNCPGQKAEK